MLAAQFTQAVATARNMAALDNVARLAWRALAEGHIPDDTAEAISEAVEARRARLKGAGLASSSKPSTARRRPVTPDKRASLERRRRCAMSGAVPATIAAAFTLAELAALSVIAAEVKRRGRCELHVEAIAAMAGVCRTVVQNATREARRLGLIRVTERRRRGQRSDTNVVEIVALEWRAWLRIGGGGFRKANTTNIQILKPSSTNYGDRPAQEAFDICSRASERLYLSSPRVNRGHQVTHGESRNQCAAE